MKKSLLKVLKRLKKKRIFLAVASGIILLLVNLGLIDVAVSEQLNEIVNTILTIGIAIGIFTNPDEAPKPIIKNK